MKRAALEQWLGREKIRGTVCVLGLCICSTLGNPEESHALYFKFPGFIQVDYILPANLTTYMAIFTNTPLKD